MRRLMYVLPLMFWLAACSHRIETGLTEHDAQEVVVTLRQHGIDAAADVEPGAKKDGSTWTVSIRGSSDKVAEAWSVLRGSGLPRKKQPGLEEVFSNSGMIPTAGEEKARLMVGLAGELAKTLNSINGVVDAHVNVVLPDNSPLADKSQQTPPSASVLVRFQGSKPPLTEAEIKSLVAKGVEGLAPESVSVVLKRVADTQLPRRAYGPFLADEWIVIGALIFASFSALGSLVLVFVSRNRKLQIQRLKQQQTTKGRSEDFENARGAVGA
jgi:type III secretion protein J